jgi:hypothetical protein
MIVLVCGSRHLFGDKVYKILSQTIRNSGVAPTKIISGGAAGIDSLAKIYANRWNIPFEEYKADWKAYGKAAGMIRNKQMVDLADVVIAVWDGESKGTENTIKLGHEKNIPVITEIIHVAKIDFFPTGVSSL